MDAVEISGRLEIPVAYWFTDEEKNFGVTRIWDEEQFCYYYYIMGKADGKEVYIELHTPIDFCTFQDQGIENEEFSYLCVLSKEEYLSAYDEAISTGLVSDENGDPRKRDIPEVSISYREIERYIKLVKTAVETREALWNSVFKEVEYE